MLSSGAMVLFVGTLAGLTSTAGAVSLRLVANRAGRWPVAGSVILAAVGSAVLWTVLSSLLARMGRASQAFYLQPLRPLWNALDRPEQMIPALIWVGVATLIALVPAWIVAMRFANFRRRCEPQVSH